MKQNGNDQKIGDYYIGLDVGTSSVGWAVTDADYNILRFHGKHMWGARLFDEANTAVDRRTARTARRRLQRQKQRLKILQILFEDEVAKTDPNFFHRMDESFMVREDAESRYSLFDDPDYKDADYHSQFPTAYHLRQELIASKEPHDVRLVFLALHHLMKSRGHFLDKGDGSDETMSLEDALSDLQNYIRENYDIETESLTGQDVTGVLVDANLRITDKKLALKNAVSFSGEKREGLNRDALCELLAGASTDVGKLFEDDELKGKKICLRDDLEEKSAEVLESLGDRADLILATKTAYDIARVKTIIGSHDYVCEAKVALYEKNKRDLATLKKYVKAYCPDKYDRIFRQKEKGLNNYAAYCRYTLESGDYACNNQEEFCKFLKKELTPRVETDEAYRGMWAEIDDNSFLTRLRGTDNGVIPYQLSLKEVRRILENASAYLPFLNKPDDYGITPKEKIIKTFSFRLPYYVGPLNSNSPRAWAVRFPGQEKTPVTPWNFEKVIDTEESAKGFINNLISLCQYTADKVLPKDSLLYSEYMLRNELNPLKVAGRPLPIDVRESMIEELFMKNRSKVTKKKIKEYLLRNGLISAEDEISGVDDTIKTTLKSYHDMKRILEKTKDTELVEKLIENILIFGDDKKMLKKWIRREAPMLDEDDVKYVCRLKYKDWGSLSRRFLTGIYSADENGEAKNIMDMLRETDKVLMQLLHDDEYQFAEKAAAIRDENLGTNRSLSEKLEDLYIAPAVRRSLRQALEIVDEIVDIRKCAPKKIFVEMARDDKATTKKQRTESRKDKVIKLYESCKEDSSVLFERLNHEEEGSLRSDKLYLYYTQLGKCMYSGETIDLDELLNGKGYDIDHIYPRSRIKDDSLDNKVLVKNTLNREKTNDYPIKHDIRSKMDGYWRLLKDKGLISEKKYDRLRRNTELTEQELASFVERQIVETRQSTRALTMLLQDAYSGAGTRVVFSKAGNVSEFRQYFKIVKCREVNDMHHARDAYLNVVVGNVYDTKFTEKFFLNIKNETYSIKTETIFSQNCAGAWEKGKTIDLVKKMVRKNDPIVTRMPREEKGALYKLQVLEKGKGQLEKKRGLDIQKYGGYNEVKGSFFFVVEHTEKKKRVRTVEPVYLYCAGFYKKDMLKYCEEKLGLRDPVIVSKAARIDSVLELDGKRYYLTGRTGTQLIFDHAYQLVLSQEYEQRIKDVIKYVERCTAKKSEIPATDEDGVSKSTNEELYDFFIEKCSTPVYSGLLDNVKLALEEKEEAFKSLSVLGQAKVIIQILKAFKSNAEMPNLSDIGGAGFGRIRESKNITKRTSACLINTSVTGLYEHKVDLLRPLEQE